MTDRLPELREIIQRSYLIDTEHSIGSLNPNTPFNETANLYFGMGGGLRTLTKGLPFDVLAMIVETEKIKRELGCSRANVLVANEITKTNPFSPVDIDRLMSAEKELMRGIVESFGFVGWNIVLQSEITSDVGYKSYLKIADERLVEIYERLFKHRLNDVHHFAMEMSDINYFLRGGGIKIGWIIPGAKVNMDEVKFDLQFKELEPVNKVSFVYVLAGVRLLKGHTGQFERDIPYISYDPNSRILLSPDEDVKAKFDNFQAKYGKMPPMIRKYYWAILRRLEELSGQHFSNNSSPLDIRIEEVIRHIYYSKPELGKVYRRAFYGNI